MTIEGTTSGTADRKPSSVLKTVLLPGCSGCGLGCLGTFLLAVLAFLLGFCLGPFNTATLGGMAGFVVVLVTAFVFRIRKRNPPWLIFCAEVGIIALLLVAFFAWDTPRYIFTSYFLSPMPKTVQIKRAHWEPHPSDPSAWLQFKARSEDFAAIIRTNDFSMRTETNTSDAVRKYSGDLAPHWWRPADLGPNAKLYSRDYYHSEHTNYVSYVVGFWVNSQSNEGYGYYISY